MNPYEIGVKLALDDVGLTKTAIDDSTLSSILTGLAFASPRFSWSLGPVASGVTAPKDKKLRAVAQSTLGAFAGGVGSMLPGIIHGRLGVPRIISLLSSGVGGGLGYHYATKD
ncbi:MAG: hypothetical protein DRJ03_02125 [Chloroflexi bacterium]|nr:MAG: hypothetical protein DRJ03_02125 [Chloroflexota bacterium]